MGEHDLTALARRLTLADIRTREIIGKPVEELLRAAVDVDLLMLGCRSMRPAQRMVVGSTSHAVARWSPVPVVVVPETWTQPRAGRDFGPPEWCRSALLDHPRLAACLRCRKEPPEPEPGARHEEAHHDHDEPSLQQ